MKIIDKKTKPEINLVELNLNKDQKGVKKISLSSKKQPIKILKLFQTMKLSR